MEFKPFFALQVVLALLSMLPFVAGLPSWIGGGWMDGYAALRQSSIGDIVPGASYIEAIVSGVNPNQRYWPKYLGIDAPQGTPGLAVIYENPSPPLFFINDRQLWQLVNQTSILRVNVMNMTGVAGHPAPLKLEFTDKESGVSGGIWRWRGTMLHYDLGKSTNKGLYFNCQTTPGISNVYMALEDTPEPEGCKFTTLHSFANRLSGERDRP